jgi:cysteine desulfurase
MSDIDNDYIYLDHNATTPVDPDVLEAMMPFLCEAFGNPSSPYTLGTQARASLEQARREVASLIGCSSQEVTFTSGGSESNNMVLKGIVDLGRPKDFHLITSAVEHPAILNPCLYLERLGVSVTVLPVDAFGRVTPDELDRAIRPNTVLVSVMLANNETGTLQPIRDLSSITKKKGIPFHTDAAQALGKVPVDVDDLGVDFLSMAGHKLYAPKGIGALYIRAGGCLTPLIHGAAQEDGKRAGTESVPLSVGLGAASRIARRRLPGDIETMKSLRDRLQISLMNAFDKLVVNGHPDERLPNTLNISIPGIEGSKILEGLPKILASTGAACHDRTVELSHVLSAMGVQPGVGMGTLRLTLGRKNTRNQIDEAVKLIINRIRVLERG